MYTLGSTPSAGQLSKARELAKKTMPFPPDLKIVMVLLVAEGILETMAILCVPFLIPDVGIFFRVPLELRVNIGTKRHNFQRFVSGILDHSLE
jgi:hypothetical protein